MLVVNSRLQAGGIQCFADVCLIEIPEGELIILRILTLMKELESNWIMSRIAGKGDLIGRK